MHLSFLSILALAPAALGIVVNDPIMKSKRTWQLSWNIDTPKTGFFLTRDWKEMEFIGVAETVKETATFRLSKELVRPGEVWIVAYTNGVPQVQSDIARS
ncbi:hypothetical protein N7533_003752 [Penicillium manginii]|uniref:uncharacterized protein n=1 Tax=Penicillium manginii TaxID=203109 RepID=UPI002547008C|nr:uncharacterized protein N7533_003752 [Penicillium manginii]KAJ5754209.1 hypothetical protein N7533_003752 [Penicillium manginii]